MIHNITRLATALATAAVLSVSLSAAAIAAPVHYEIVSGTLGATTASFKDGTPFTLTPDDRTSGWVGRCARRRHGGMPRCGHRRRRTSP